MPLQIRSEVKSDNTFKMSLAEVDMPAPGDDEVVIRVEATPINPSDLALLIGPADMTTAKSSGSAQSPVVTADIPETMMASQAPRLDKSMPVGNEGAGVVVAAGKSKQAQALLGKVVSAAGGGMYSQYRAVNAALCLPMPEGIAPRQAASSFVNPLTALGMTETMRMEGHTALVHTAAASNLGQMLNKICINDGIDLVNIVRKPEQKEILKAIGAKYIIDSSSNTFMSDLVDALVKTGATLAFDAIGGGKLGSDILTAMEIAANKTATEYSPYGSVVHKQVYMYGGLDRSPVILSRAFGMYWGVGGWLLTPFLQKVGFEKMIELQTRVAAEITTTFKSEYTAEVSLAETVSIDAIKEYGKQATGTKYLINPNK